MVVPINFSNSEHCRSISFHLLKKGRMIFYDKLMRHFQTRRQASAGLGIFGAAIMAIWGLKLWRSAITRRQEVKVARARNKAACDSFILRHGLPDCQSIVLATDGVARLEARNEYWDPDSEQALPDVLRRRSLETYIVVSLAPTAHHEGHRSLIHSPTTLATRIVQCVSAG